MGSVASIALRASDLVTQHERCALGAFLVDPSLLTAEPLLPEDVTEGFHRDLLRSMRLLLIRRDPVDPVALMGLLRDQYPDVLDRICDLASSLPACESGRRSAVRVFIDAQHRRHRAAALALRNRLNAGEPHDDVAADYRRELAEILARNERWGWLG